MILDTILARKREEVAASRASRSLASLRAEAEALAARLRGGSGAAPDGGGGEGDGGAGGTLARALAGPSLAVLAEIKYASPSEGRFPVTLPPEEVAARYRRAGVQAVSVLTDGPFFGGKLEYLAEARRAAGLPVLRKDFVIDPYQLYETRLAGADGVLLIAAALSGSALRELVDLALSLALDPLVEVHTPEELERACGTAAPLVGINHRNLHTFQVDLSLTQRLAPEVPQDRVLVAESGVRGPGDLARLAAWGADAVLVGSALMRQADPAPLAAALAREAARLRPGRAGRRATRREGPSGHDRIPGAG